LEGDYETTSKVLIPEDTYEGASVVEVDDVKPYKSFDKPGEFDQKIRMTWAVKVGEKTEQIPVFLKNIITKGGAGGGGKTFSNSKMYDFLEKANMLETFRLQAEKLKDDKLFVEFLRKSFIEAKPKPTFKVMVRTVGKTGGKPYSVVDKIIRRL